MSELRSVVEAFRSEMLPDLPDARIEEDFAELQRAVELLEAERLRRLCEIDRRRLFERDGHLSSASWLATRHKVAWGTARENVRISRALDDMPETRRALDEGQISMSAVRVLAAARDADPTAFGVSEPQLVEAARIHSMHDLQRVASYWRQGVEGEQAATGDEKARERRKLHASVSFLGMVRVDGDLDPETGETLLTALGAVLDAEARSRGRDDIRTPAQRRADALGEICRQWLDRSDRPTVAGERPHVTVTVDADSLTPGTGVAAELDHAGPVDPETAPARMRRIIDARGDVGSLAAARRRPPNLCGVPRHAARRDRSRSLLPVPGV